MVFDWPLRIPVNDATGKGLGGLALRWSGARWGSQFTMRREKDRGAGPALRSPGIIGGDAAGDGLGLTAD